MKAEHYIALGVVAIAGFLLLMKNRGQQFLVNNDIPLPAEAESDIVTTRPSTRGTGTRISDRTSTARRTTTASTSLSTSVPRTDRIARGDIVSGTLTEEIVYSPPGNIGPVLTEGVRVPIGDKSVFIERSNLTQI